MPKDEGVRPAYKAFLDSPGGRDFMEHLVGLELYAQAQGKRAETADQKAFEMVKIGLLYDIRTYLVDMSKPPSSPRNAPKG